MVSRLARRRCRKPDARAARLRGATGAIALMGGLLALPAPATGQAVDARLEPARVTVGGTTELVVEIAAGKLRVDVSEPELPPLPGLEVVPSGRSSEVRLTGTEISRRTVFRYTLRPRSAGTVWIDPIHVRVDGVDHVTRSLRLLVVDASELDPAEAFAGGPPAIFAVTRVDRRAAWVGEQITLTFAFYHDPRVPLGESPDYDPPETPGFWRIEIDDQPVVAAERIGGRTYHVQRFRYALFPLREGELTIGPATVRVVEPDPDRWWTPGRPRAIETESLTVVARPLPAGAPAGYDGAVGRFRLAGTVEERSVAAGTPLELELVVEGTGNPTAVPPPDLPGWPEVNVGSPSVESTTSVRGGTVGGRTTFRFLLTPLQPGGLDLGDARLAYFDPTRGEYAVDTLRLGELHVEPGPTIAAAEAEPTGPTLWEARPPTVSGPRGWAGKAWYWAALAGPWAAWLLAIGATRLRRYATSAPAAGTVARERLREARRGLVAGREAAPAEAAAAVRALVDARWGARLADADPDRLEAGLEAVGAEPAVAAAVAEARRATAAAAYGRGDPVAAAEAVERLEAALGRSGGRGLRARTLLPILLVSVLATAIGALGQDRSLAERWEDANRAYREGEFGTAASLYADIAAEVPDPRLEADRAAALWRAGEGGAAVAAYLRSLELDPRGWRVRADLADLRAGLGDPPAVAGSRPGFLEYVRLDEWLAALLAVSWATFLTALLARRRPGARLPLRVLTGILVSIAVLAALDAATGSRDRAVVRSDTEIRSEPHGRGIAGLPEGAVVGVLERRAEAWRVRAEGLPAGWVASDRIVPLH